MSARLVLGGCAAAAVSLLVVTGLAGAAPGDLDQTFGAGGQVSVPIATYGAGSFGSAVQADNKLVLVGMNFQMAPPPPPPAPHRVPRIEDEDFFTLRLTDNGGVDSSFGSNGIVRTPINLDPGARDLAHGVAIAPDGKIVVAGDAGRADGTSDPGFVRYTTAGELDPTFSDDGIQTVHLGTESGSSGVVVQPDGKVVAAAVTATYFGFEALRLNADGTLDPSFGVGGVVRTPIGDPSLLDDSSAVALDGDRIVIAGSADDTNQSSAFAVARYLPDGQLDPSFGTGGVAITPGPRLNVINAVAVTGEGKIVAVGFEGDGTGRVIRVVRYLADGALDTTFGGTGIVTTAIGAFAIADSIVIEPDGKMIVGGGNDAFTLVRYNDDGSLDSSFGGGGVRTYPVGAHGADATSLLIQHLDGGRDRLVQTGTAWENAGGEFAAAGVQLDGAANPPPPPPPPVPPPPVPPPPVPPPPPVRHCLVPRLIGLRLARAKARIQARGCTVGRVRRTPSRRARGVIISQKPRAGLLKPFRTRVALVVSRGLVPAGPRR